MTSSAPTLADPTGHRNLLRAGLLKLAGSMDDMHVGAAICASAYFRQSLASGEAMSAIESKLRTWLEGESPVGGLRPGESRCDPEPVLRALSETCSSLHFIGHDVIFAAWALRLIHDLDGDVAQEPVAMVSERIRSLGEAHPGLFEKYSMRAINRSWARFDGYEQNASPSAVVDSMLETLRRIHTTYFGFHFQAQEVHLITHAHALFELDALGHTELYHASLKSWYFKLSLLEPIYRPRRPKRLRAAPSSICDPGDQCFWREMTSIHPHRIKATYAYSKLKAAGLISTADAKFMDCEKMPFLTAIDPEETAA